MVIELSSATAASGLENAVAKSLTARQLWYGMYAHLPRLFKEPNKPLDLHKPIQDYLVSRGLPAHDALYLFGASFIWFASGTWDISDARTVRQRPRALITVPRNAYSTDGDHNPHLQKFDPEGYEAARKYLDAGFAVYQHFLENMLKEMRCPSPT